MTKTTITEVTETFDKDGKLVEKTTRTETSEDDTAYTYHPAWSEAVSPLWNTNLS